MQILIPTSVSISLKCGDHLERWPGRKAVVRFAGRLRSIHDRNYKAQGPYVLKSLVLGFLLTTISVPALAQAVRSEIPIKEQVLSNGARRYAVAITVGETEVTAGLDTGSSGLRVLPNVLKPTDVVASERKSSYSYGSGTKLDGVNSSAVVGIGGQRGKTTLQIISKVACTASKPQCPAARIPLTKYGIQGDGLPGEGFKAILGVAMTDADVASTFMGIGAKRWIIELPRPDERHAGRLILNPTANEIADFVMVPIMAEFSHQKGGLHDAVNGCLVNQKTRASICGAVDLDTGMNGLRILAAGELDKSWLGNDNAVLLFSDAAGKILATEHLKLNMKNHASRITSVRQDRSTAVIHSGLTAYFAYSVLYDPENGVIGLKPRRPLPDGPRGNVE